MRHGGDDYTVGWYCLLVHCVICVVYGAVCWCIVLCISVSCCALVHSILYSAKCCVVLVHSIVKYKIGYPINKVENS